MLKLYRKQNNVFEYWETWDNDENRGIVHWGIVGERGMKKEVTSTIFNNFHNIIQKEINLMIKKNYNPFKDDDLIRLLIEYKINEHGSETDLIKRQKLEKKMNETLGWTGLGHCDGGSIGSGTMEVCCFVVDFDIAKQVIENDLKNTEFQNYTRIFNEDD